jgi:hypothetical protein
MISCEVRIFCDEPGCRVSYSSNPLSLVTAHSALLHALDHNWTVTHNGKHFCPKHSTEKNQTTEALP